MTGSQDSALIDPGVSSFHAIAVRRGGSEEDSSGQPIGLTAGVLVLHGRVP